MSAPGAVDQPPPLTLLHFFLGGAAFGVDIEQLAAIGVYRGEEDDDLYWLHRALGYETPPPYRAPRILSIKDNGAGELKPYRLIIEAPEDVREFDWRQIRPVPPLLAPRLNARGLWGVLPLAGTMILLLDCQRLNLSM